MAKSSAVTTDIWKGQLNFDRACTSSAARGRCWLIDDLVAWNRVLYELEYALVEDCPGKLSLRHLPHDDVDELSIDAGRKAAFLISWLVEHHGCIEELRLWCTGFPHENVPQDTPIPIRLRPAPGRGIRCLEVQMSEMNFSNKPSLYCLVKEDIDALSGIEELKLFSCDSRLEPTLVRLVEHNCNSLKLFEMVNTKLSRRMVHALQRLEKCESMVIGLRRSDDDTYSDTDALTRLVQGGVGVKKLSIVLSGNSDCSITGLAQAVEASATLTMLELAMFSDRSSPTELFTALTVNASVKVVRVHFVNLDVSCAEALALALSTNSCLTDMHLHGTVTDDCMIRMAGALSQNTTMTKLQFTVGVESVNGVIALCQVLRTNKTLKKLEFPVFDASETDRKALAKTLAHGDGYRRVLLPLAEPDLPVLSTLLTCPASCPEELDQVPICSVTEANLQLFLDALNAPTCRVQMLSVSISEDPGPKIRALGRMLRANRSIRRMYIIMHSDAGLFLNELLDALEVNKSVCELGISSGAMQMETVAALSDFFSRNRTITTFRLSILPMDLEQFEHLLAPGPFAEVMSLGMVMNPVLVEFDGAAGYQLSRTSYLIFETLRKNTSRLNRAVDFVLLRSKDRVGAQAFELFFGRPCLLEHVMKTSGRTECEALLAIASAHNFLLDNYLTIAGVVMRSVVCYPNDKATQCDDLNAECWREITRHLKVSDVLS